MRVRHLLMVIKVVAVAKIERASVTRTKEEEETKWLCVLYVALYVLYQYNLL